MKATVRPIRFALLLLTLCVALASPALAQKQKSNDLTGFPLLWVGKKNPLAGPFIPGLNAALQLSDEQYPRFLARVKVLQAAFAQAPFVRVLERTLSWLAWGAVVLWVTGILPVLLEELDQIHWKVGGSMLSVRTLIEGSLTAGAVLIVSLWVSSAIEAQLLRSAWSWAAPLPEPVAGDRKSVV